jgi:hypothetical protein
MRVPGLLLAALAPVLVACGSQSPSAAGGSAPPPDVGAPPPAYAPPVGSVPETPPPLQDDEFMPCAGKACGEACTMCSPGAADCVETMVVKQCNAQGTCVSEPVECPK